MSATTIPLAAAGENGTNGLAIMPASRASWTGQIAIGKLVVPVKAYAAVVTSTASSLHQVHARCGQSIQYRKTCPYSEKTLPRNKLLTEWHSVVKSHGCTVPPLQQLLHGLAVLARGLRATVGRSS